MKLKEFYTYGENKHILAVPHGSEHIYHRIYVLNF
jgi:hypothetical protein